MSSVFLRELGKAATLSRVTLHHGVADACAVHFALLLRWNKTHNLTRVVDPAQAVRKHYLDCLVPLLALRAEREISSFVDVGSGAGFPGLLACLVWPQAAAILVEPTQKRASFLVLAARAMGLAVTLTPPEATPVGAELVLSRATFSAGKRGALLRPAGDAVAVWGHPPDASTWKNEVATWPGWRSATQEYEIAGLEPRALLWAFRGEYHVERACPIC